MASASERRRFGAVVLVVLILDQASKFAAEALLPRYVGLSVIGDFFQLRLVYNPGAAFGLHVGEHSRWVFMALSILALVVLGSMLRQTRSGDWLRLYSLASICAGAAGNLIDRIRSGRGVVDFLDFTFGSYHFPTFNIADSAVTVGAVALAISLWNEGKGQQGVPAQPPPEASAETPPAGA
ncbi:MAG TPA: signal peptidase II [Gemmatimonadales bacterium]|nr:signal peptidase II [Gemmatimonadales bacterium]